MSAIRKWFIRLPYLVHLLCHAAFLRIVSKDHTSFLMISSLAQIYPDKHIHMNLLEQKLPWWWSFTMTSSCRHRHPSYRLTHLLMICFVKGLLIYQTSVRVYISSQEISYSHLLGFRMITASWHGCISWSLLLCTFLIPRNKQLF